MPFRRCPPHAFVAVDRELARAADAGVRCGFGQNIRADAGRVAHADREQRFANGHGAVRAQDGAAAEPPVSSAAGAAGASGGGAGAAASGAGGAGVDATNSGKSSSCMVT